MGMIRKAETLLDYAHNIGFEQGGNEQNWCVSFKQFNEREDRQEVWRWLEPTLLPFEPSALPLNT